MVQAGVVRSWELSRISIGTSMGNLQEGLCRERQQQTILQKVVKISKEKVGLGVKQLL